MVGNWRRWGSKGKIERVPLNTETPAYVGNSQLMTHEVVSSYAIQGGRQAGSRQACRVAALITSALPPLSTHRHAGKGETQATLNMQASGTHLH